MENLGTIGEFRLAAPLSHDPRKNGGSATETPPGSGGVVVVFLLRTYAGEGMLLER